MAKKEGSKKDDKKRKKKVASASLDHDPPTFDNDPPIIVSGGSVTIASKVFFSVTYDPKKERYIYQTTDIKIGKIKTKGKKDQEDESNAGKFTIELFSE